MKDEERRKILIEEYLKDKNELKELVHEAEGLEDFEMETLNKWDTHLNNLLLNKGESIELEEICK